MDVLRPLCAVKVSKTGEEIAELEAHSVWFVLTWLTIPEADTLECRELLKMQAGMISRLAMQLVCPSQPCSASPETLHLHWTAAEPAALAPANCPTRHQCLQQ